MGAAKDILAPYLRGKSDCEQGKSQQSNDPDYIQGYGEQYALEQCQARQTELIMEQAHERRQAD